MTNEENWYRQLGALVLLSGSRAAVEFITNPGARSDASNQLKDAFREIDYEGVAKAITRAIDDLADNSKSALTDSIDTLRDKGHEAVDEAKTRAEKQLAQKKGHGKLKFLFLLTIAGVVAYFLFDEQRRDDLLDRMTGASGPVQQSSYTTFQSSQATPAAGTSATETPAAGAPEAVEEVAETVKAKAKAAPKKAPSTEAS
jgi:cell division septation protein DedD